MCLCHDLQRWRQQAISSGPPQEPRLTAAKGVCVGSPHHWSAPDFLDGALCSILLVQGFTVSIYGQEILAANETPSEIGTNGGSSPNCAGPNRIGHGKSCCIQAGD